MGAIDRGAIVIGRQLSGGYCPRPLQILFICEIVVNQIEIILIPMDLIGENTNDV